MTQGSHDDAAAAAAAIITHLGDGLGDLVGGVQQMLLEQVPDLDGDAQVMALLRDTIETNIEAVFSAIRHGIALGHVEPPTAALEHGRRMAQRGVSVNAVMRGYRLGHKAVLDVVLAQVRCAGLEAQLAFDVFGQVADMSFGYIDSISEQVVAAYQDERDRWLENQNSLRAVRVREVLDGADVDVDVLTEAIRYPLSRIHLAVTAWYVQPADGQELVAMEKFIQQLAVAVGAHESPLFIPVDRLMGWAWIPLDADIAGSCVQRARAFARMFEQAPWVAVGDPVHGVEGFRLSHLQAQDARAVALTVGHAVPRFVAASDPGLSMAALLGGNIDAASAWVAKVLGPLACHSDNDERLRETLRVFLRCGASFKAAADELHLHHNSVKYRVARAVERRGRPIDDDRLDVEVALLVCGWFGATVLRPL
ncbi:PucR family transcriptional regulator [Mycobacterium paraterrae]|uniref:Helix-turn-helix domain-containing protein n=1 Tax=Mycobacterium paraterrae TaxID=577492 RepID=A0ABY3VL04_9MYCO|nr:helix-turn-helix domain-containing protein [Mycobacterium paraterrae]UMB70095.1 helix-turn-helix domain-containing protein [Mycobacterium paraterrae]